MNVTLVTDQAGIDKMAKFLEKVGADALPILGLDTETNFVHDFWQRRVRVILSLLELHVRQVEFLSLLLC